MTLMICPLRKKCGKSDCLGITPHEKVYHCENGECRHMNRKITCVEYNALTAIAELED